MKKPLHKLWVALLLALLSPTALTAQRVLWDVDFDFRFDNREYGNPSRMIAPSETIFGAKLIPIIGVEWNDGRNLRISSVHHWDGTNFGWQQVVSLTTYFGTANTIR